MKQPTGFLGTYFDRDAVLRVERWARLIAWSTLAAYAFESGYNAFQNIYGAITGGYPLDLVLCLYDALAHFAGRCTVYPAACRRESAAHPARHRRQHPPRRPDEFKRKLVLQS